MGHELTPDGWKSLNSAYYWKNVMVTHDHPTVLIQITKNIPPKQLADILGLWENPASLNYNVIIETLDSDATLYSPTMGYNFRNDKSLIGEERDASWKKVDILFCPEEREDMWVPAMLSGVTVYHDFEEFRNQTKGVKLLENMGKVWGNSLVRIENYEKAQEIIKKTLDRPKLA